MTKNSNVEYNYKTNQKIVIVIKYSKVGVKI